MLDGGISARRHAALPTFAVWSRAARPRCAGVVVRQLDAPPPVTARHFVLVTIDTLRADRVGVYGGVDLTPRLDRIAREGAYAANATAHVPLTRPSHATIFVGPVAVGDRRPRQPVAGGASAVAAPRRDPEGRRAFGPRAFVSSIVLDRRGGFARGFDRYEDELPETQSADLLNTLQKPGAETVRAAIAWLESQRAADRLFLWVHLYEPHDPYEPPEPYASRYRDRPYDGEVAYADALVGQLDDALERLGLESQTLLAVASDHGEGLGEHEETLHGFFVYQTTLAVPLILRGPGIVGGGGSPPTSGSSICCRPRSICWASRRRAAVQPSGNSLGRSAARRRPRRRPASPQYAESLVPLLHFGWSDLRVLRRGSWKYVLAPRPELYDLAADPHEQHNLVGGAAGASRGASRDAGEDARAGAARRRRRPRPRPCRPICSNGSARSVTSAASAAATATPGADPKDKILEFRHANEVMRDGILALNRREYAAAARRVRGTDRQRHRELRGAPVSRPSAGRA